MTLGIALTIYGLGICTGMVVLALAVCRKPRHKEAPMLDLSGTNGWGSRS